MVLVFVFCFRKEKNNIFCLSVDWSASTCSITIVDCVSRPPKELLSADPHQPTGVLLSVDRSVDGSSTVQSIDSVDAQTEKWLLLHRITTSCKAADHSAIFILQIHGRAKSALQNYK